MFKKLFLVLVLVVFLMAPLSADALQSDQECTLIAGSRVVQVMPDRLLRGVIVPAETDILIGPEIPNDIIRELNSKTNLDWTGSHVGMIQVDFGQGPAPVMLFIKPSDVKDCE